MEITRQSEYYGLDHDAEPVHKEAELSPQQIKSLLAGPQIQPGLLNY